MHTIKGTAKIKGALNLPTLKTQLIKNKSVLISNEEFNANDIQIALKMGYIEHEGSSAVPHKEIDKEDKDNRNVKCKNIYNRSLSLPEVATSIAPNQEFILKESDLKHSDIKTVLRKGWIEIIKFIDADEYTEQFVKIGDMFSEQQSKTNEEKRSEAEKFKNELEESFNDDKRLETNEEITTPITVIDTEDPDPIEPSSVPDAKKASVTWNPTNAPIINEMKGAKVVARPISSSDDGEDDIDDILFADHEAELKRIKSHPVLNDADEKKQNSEVYFVE